MSRAWDELRPVKITPHYQNAPAGSCLIEVGGTRVLCSATLEDSVPHFLKGSGKGWVTGEYNMLPGSSSQRIRRERSKIGGRTQEIQRLIGRSLRSVVDFEALGERSILIDCDVIDADGGTRTASITGGYVALALALQKAPSLVENFPSPSSILKMGIAAVSVGIVEGKPYLDLDYQLDKNADVDMNVVRTSTNQYIEVQGTGENAAFSDEQLTELLSLANKGITQLIEIQNSVLG